MRLHTRQRFVPASILLTAALLVTLLSACGSGGESVRVSDPVTIPIANGDGGSSDGDAQATQDFDTGFSAGLTPFAVQASVQLAYPAPVRSATFSVRTKPGHTARDFRVTYPVAYLERKGLLDLGAGTVRFTVFGLYLDHANAVTIRLDLGTAGVLSHEYTIHTDRNAPAGLVEALDVRVREPGLSVDYLFLQRHDGPALVDVDGEVRWVPPSIGTYTVPLHVRDDGILLGRDDSRSIYAVSWLGTIQQMKLSDVRCTSSHHTIEPGKTGLLNTVGYQDGDRVWPESVLVEMTPAGQITKQWNFDQIFTGTIAAKGEDPSALVLKDADWFHMNSAIYDSSDDGILVSSREHFVVKVDYTTGAIRWILGNPAKSWYQDFPSSLQPLALTCTGDPPIGQHSLSLSADGTLLTCFNNGKGHLSYSDIGDSRTSSKVSVYAIDEEAGTAQEVLALDGGLDAYAPVCSSAYRTKSGDMIALFTAQDRTSPAQIVIVSDTDRIWFEARVLGDRPDLVYAAREFRPGDLRFD